MEAFDYKVILQVDMQPAIEWPPGIPAPVVGDEVSGQLGGAAFSAKVVRRAWGVGPAPSTDVQTVALVITAETPQPAKPARASVEPLRI